jgi:hypothetical protein
MAKLMPLSTADAFFDYIDQADTVYVCSGASAPADRAAAIAASLATTSMTVDTGDYTKSGAAGAARVLTIAAKGPFSVTATGDATHIVLCRTADASMRYVTTCTTQTLTSGNTVTVPSWTITLNQPT